MVSDLASLFSSCPSRETSAKRNSVKFEIQKIAFKCRLHINFKVYCSDMTQIYDYMYRLDSTQTLKAILMQNKNSARRQENLTFYSIKLFYYSLPSAVSDANESNFWFQFPSETHFTAMACFIITRLSINWNLLRALSFTPLKVSNNTRLNLLTGFVQSRCKLFLGSPEAKIKWQFLLDCLQTFQLNKVCELFFHLTTFAWMFINRLPLDCRILEVYWNAFYEDEEIAYKHATLMCLQYINAPGKEYF